MKGLAVVPVVVAVVSVFGQKPVKLVDHIRRAGCWPVAGRLFRPGGGWVVVPVLLGWADRLHALDVHLAS